MIQEVIDKIEKRLRELDEKIILLKSNMGNWQASGYYSRLTELLTAHSELTQIKKFCHEIKDRP